MIQKILYGRKRELSLPNGEKRQAQFALVELGEITASHHEITFSSSAGYPVNEYGQNINDRNYKDDPAAQRQVEQIAENLEPEKLVELSSKASGTPIISPEGFVVSGNNRVMSLKLAVRKFPHSYERYKKYLAQEIDVFGFPDTTGVALLMNEAIALPDSSYTDPRSVRFEYPVLVRIDLGILQLNTSELAKYNVDTRKGERPVDRSVKLGNILRENERCRSVILSIIDGYDTFTELYDSKARADRQRLVKTFVDCGLINEAKLPDYYNDGEFTEGGKDFIENVLAAIVLSPDALKVAGSAGVRRLRQTIVSLLPVLISNDNLDEGSLKAFIAQAVIFQYKMSKVGDFRDYVLSQDLFLEEAIPAQAVYLNRLFNEGRNRAKAALVKYNESVRSNAGQSLFLGEKLTLPHIFTATIAAAIAPEDGALIEKIYGSAGSAKNNAMEMEIVSSDLAVLPARPDARQRVKAFSNDAFFLEHPDRILGKAIEVSGRFGPVTKYEGDLSAIERIDVPLDFIGNDRILNDPLLSTETSFNLSAEVMTPAVQELLVQVNKKSRDATGQVLLEKDRKKKVVVEDENILTPEMPPLNTFEEMYRRHNPAISKEELEVFLWYKTEIRKPLSRRWVNLLEEQYFNDLSEPVPYQVPEERRNQWVQQGLLYYFSDRYLPAFLYLSGDIYARKFQLERDKAEILSAHGQPVYDRQEEALSQVFRQKYDSRLLIGTPGSEDGLVILPISKFADNFYIEGLESMAEGEPFKIRKVTAASDRKAGQPDFRNDINTREDKKHDFSKLSLKAAFSYWLIRSNPEIKENVTALDIVKYYLEGSPVRGQSLQDKLSPEEKAQMAKFKASMQREGERLFKVFLDSELTVNDKVRLETEWNGKFNNHVSVDYNKVPVAFTMAKYYKGKPEELRPEKREAVAFILDAGAGCLAYDVGVGKTPSAIFTISAFLDAGYSRRPFICVPNQVYKQFIQEIKEFAPHIPVLEAYNLGEGYIDNFKNATGGIDRVPAGCITVMTYEGLERIGFSDNTADALYGEMYRILDQGGQSESRQTKRQEQSFAEKILYLLGKGLRSTQYNIEDFGFDFACYDEAHRLKKVFTSVKGEETTDAKGKTVRGKNPYVITSGSPSSIGLKAFMLNQYILKQNSYQNILLLTATPFTNSPLEIFSMLAMLAYEQLQSTDLNNIKNFFDTYIQTSTELVINPKLKPEFKQVIHGFNNLVSLQTLIRRYINYKTGEDVNVQRPNKYVLPYTHKMVEGTMITLPEEEKVETFLSMSPQQKAMMDDIVLYVEGKMSLDQLGTMILNKVEEMPPTEESDEMVSEGEEIEEDTLTHLEKAGVRTLRGMNFASNLALSPYLYEFSGMGQPDYFDYIESSPKLKYMMLCIKTVKEFHEEKGQPVSGQIIYLDRGIDYFPLIREYLIKEIGFKPHEVAIIKSGMPAGAKKGSKEYIKNLYNGEIYNVSTKLFEAIPDEERIKVLIGSSTIKEGINLQRYSSVLYDGWLDWNPTDFMQLCGRLWRQGNIFGSVRIVLPLLTDSMDIFKFQKLQEKTTRLNSIWSTDGRRNVLKLEDIDPAELKYALIRDPITVAHLKVVDQAAAIDSEILGIERLSDRMGRIKQYVKTINSRFDAAIEQAELYRNYRATSDKLKDAQQLVLLIQDVLKKQTDKTGRKMVPKNERNQSTVAMKKFSPINPAYKQHWFDDFNIAQRNLSREVRDFIRPRDIDFSLEDTSGLDRYAEEKKKSVETMQAEKEKLFSPENLKLIADEVIRERIEKKIAYKPILEVVADFTRLNYLLEDKKVATRVEKPLFDSCPPRENGKLAISEEAIAALDKCLANLPQTKSLHIDPSTGQYKPEREALHQQIIGHLLEAVRCIKQGRPIAVFTGGSPGAGKTHFLRRHAEYLLSQDVFHLDADDIRSMLPEYEGWNANATHQESQDIVNQVLATIGEGKCRYDFIYDGTMNKANRYFTLIKRARDMGYETFIIFIQIPFGVARTRVLERYQKTGRYVPMAVLEEFHEKLPSGRTRGQDALDLLKPVVDGYVVVNGLNGEIIERHGIELPRDRQYGNFLMGPAPEPAPAPEPVVKVPAAGSDKEQLQAYIETLTLSLKYLSGTKKKEAKEQIATFKLSLKFL